MLGWKDTMVSFFKKKKAIAGWIWLANLRPFVDILAGIVDYDLADGEWNAIYFGVKESDSDAIPPQWYEYEFQGSKPVKFKIGHDKGTQVVQVCLKAPAAVVGKIAFALDLMSQYTLSNGA